ncbi:hypothetical protein A2336_03745 [Candidatus Peregrinibacteria bacterium RIFOXYB2_FULL_41_88]|nr:MAG: hypothetical protein A2336_03745 [Candidatus Peregrinibacteria bacterium RIFOXYB2_FULL_41_88]
MKEALAKATEGRAHIMSKMLEALPASRAQLSPYAPLITTIKINPEKIREVIGKGGETIQKITAECGVEIDIEDEGLVMVTAPNQESGQKAVDWINSIVADPIVGNTYDAKVVKIMEFGAFVEFMPGKQGLVHVSKLSAKRVDNVEDVVQMGQVIKVKLMEVDREGRYNLSYKDAKQE